MSDLARAILCAVTCGVCWAAVVHALWNVQRGRWPSRRKGTR